MFPTLFPTWRPLLASLPVVRFSLLERLEETEISDLTGRISLLRRPDCPSEARPSPGTRVTNTSNYISDLRSLSGETT